MALGHSLKMIFLVDIKSDCPLWLFRALTSYSHVHISKNMVPKYLNWVLGPVVLPGDQILLHRKARTNKALQCDKLTFWVRLPTCCPLQNSSLSPWIFGHTTRKLPSFGGLSLQSWNNTHACLLLLQGSANPQTPGSKKKRIKICVLLPAAGRDRNFFSSFSRNLGFVDLPIPVLRRHFYRGHLAKEGRWLVSYLNLLVVAPFWGRAT